MALSPVLRPLLVAAHSQQCCLVPQWRSRCAPVPGRAHWKRCWVVRWRACRQHPLREARGHIFCARSASSRRAAQGTALLQFATSGASVAIANTITNPIGAARACAPRARRWPARRTVPSRTPARPVPAHTKQAGQSCRVLLCAAELRRAVAQMSSRSGCSFSGWSWRRTATWQHQTWCAAAVTSSCVGGHMHVAARCSRHRRPLT